jgi:hypothetical protein
MANEATAELYTRQSGLNKAKLKTDYEQYLADLATKYGISGQQLNTNLESRGILRSGEAGEARTRLGAAEQAARTAAQGNYDYNVANEDVSLATKLAGLMAGTTSAGGGTGGGSTTGGNTGGNTGTTTSPYTNAYSETNNEMRNRGTRPPAAVAPVATPPTTAVAYSGGNTQGTLPQAVTLPAGFDMSGFMTPTKPKPTAQKPGNFGLQNYIPPKPATVRINPVSARNR